MPVVTRDMQLSSEDGCFISMGGAGCRIALTALDTLVLDAYPDSANQPLVFMRVLWYGFA